MSNLALLTFLAIFTGLLARGAGIFLGPLIAAAALGCGVLLVAAVVSRKAAPPAVAVRVPPGVRLAYLGALVVLALTSLPLPGRASFLAGPRRYEQNEHVIAIADRAAAAGAVPRRQLWFAATRNRAGTARVLLCLALAFSGAGLARRLEPRQRQGLVVFLIAAGVAVAVIGHIGQWWIPQGDTLWHAIPVPHGLPGPVGGFVNPNHFAGFLALLLPLALAATLDAWLRRRILPGLAALAALLTMAAAMVASLSRGGIVAGAAGLLVTAVWSARRHRRSILVGGFSLLAAAAIVIAVCAALPPVRERLLTLRAPLATTSFHERVDAWRGALRIWRSYPLIGCGANAFRVVYPQFRHTTERDYRTFAENEYVQLAAETGVVGLALLLTLVAGPAIARRRTARAGVPAAPDPATPAFDDTVFLSAAVAGAVTVAATHALVEFVPHLPLYAFTLATLIALPTPASRPSPANPPPRATDTWKRTLLPALTLAAVLATLPWRNAIQNRDSLGFASAASAADLLHALSWAPTSSHLWVRLGERFATADAPAVRKLADRAATRGLAYDTNNCTLWVRLGEVRLRIGDRRGAKAAFDRARELRAWISVPEVTLD